MGLVWCPYAYGDDLDVLGKWLPGEREVMMTDVAKLRDPYPNEVWHPSAVYRWARKMTGTIEQDVLQVAWQSNYGRTEWRRVQVEIVSDEDYYK